MIEIISMQAKVPGALIATSCTIVTLSVWWSMCGQILFEL